MDAIIQLKVQDISHGSKVLQRAMILQKNMHLRPIQFEITEQTRESITIWLTKASLYIGDFLFPNRNTESPHITTRQYARIVKSWVSMIGLDPDNYGTRSLRRTKSTLIYLRTKKLRVVQQLPAHTKLESNVRYLEIEVDDVLEISEQTEV